MRSPDIGVERKLSAQDIEASFKVCKICGFVPERHVGGGIYKPFHDMEKHGLSRPVSERMETEDLMNIPRVLP